MFGRREDPSRALELADSTKPLEPRAVEEVLLGDLLVAKSSGDGVRPGDPFCQLHVAVDRVADEVDRPKRMARHLSPRTARRRAEPSPPRRRAMPAAPRPRPRRPTTGSTA